MRKSLEETLFHWLSVLLFIVGALLLLSFQPAWALTEPAATKVSQETAYGSLPLLFIPNQGQFDNQVAYAVQGRDKSIYFTAQGLTFVLSESPAPAATRPKARDLRQTGPPAPEAKPPQQRWAIKMDFVDANPMVRPESLEQAGTLISYFKGQPEEWLTGLQASHRIIYRDLWPGIDLIYSGTVNRLKYDLIVHPGADPARIKLAWRGADSVQVTPEGRLAITTPLGTLQDEMPVAWQEGGGDGPRENVTMAYHLQGPKEVQVAAAHASRGLLAGTRPREHAQVVGFIVGDYDRTRPLVLDPEMLIYCGFIGGSGYEWVGGIAVDSNGNAYVTGVTNYSTDGSFPATVGPDLSYNDIGGTFVAKVRADGTGLAYCGFIGGTDEGDGIAVDSSGNAYVTGLANLYPNGSFPATVGPDLSSNGSNDAFVAKVRADGTGLVYCGFIGGDGFDYGRGIAVDSSGNAYVTGNTDSTDGSLATVGPDLSYNGDTDAFVAKVKADGTGLAYCGFIGGAGSDSGWGIAVDNSGNAYVTGQTDSTDGSFPATVGPDLSHNGEEDAFVAKVRADGTGLAYCGFIGGTWGDEGYGIAVDSNGNAYVTGVTSYSTDGSFPATVGPDLSYNGKADAFVAKVQADGTGLTYCGYVGGAGSDIGYGIAVDINGNAYVSGGTSSTEESFPAAVGPDLSYNGKADAFVAKVQADGTGLTYCGYVGGAGSDIGYGIAVDNKGNAYVTGLTYSTDGSFPATVGPDLSHNGGDMDVFVAKITMGQDFVPPGYLGRIRQSPLHGDPGTTFTQSGAGFTPNSTVTLHFRNQLGEELTPIQLATDAQGSFSINYTAPQDKPFGTHTWWAVDGTTGRQSATIGYQITGPIGAQTNLPIGPPPAIIPVAQGDDIFGTLMRPFPFDPGKESFVIVHGWNPDGTSLLPGWMVQMGSAIHSDPKSQAPGANVFYWNWQDKARSKDTSIFQFGSGVEPVDYIQAVLSVPFDNVTDSGKMLANALQLAIPAGYDKKIHLVGHSLGTGVITYATKRALSDKYNYHYKNNIEHLTFLDSPWLFDRPADSFLKSIENKVFFDNYWSMWGKRSGYWESDTNIYLQMHFKLFSSSRYPARPCF